MNAPVVQFTLPPLVQRLTPDDITERLDAVKGEDCLLSFYGPQEQSLVMFRIDGKYVAWWFAEGPLSRENAVDIVQRESLKEHLPQSRNHFYIIAEAPDTNSPENTLDD